MREEVKAVDLPTLEQIEAELKVENGKREYRLILRSTVFVLLLVTAAAVIVAVFLFPVLEIKGGAMEPTLKNGQYVVTINTSGYQQGDVIAFYYDNTLLVKRVIAVGGDQVDIDADGNVSVNGKELREPYVSHKVLGDGDETFPLVVPDDEYFVLGDNRSQSVDSRNAALGTVAQERVVGKLLFRVWPLGAAGKIS